MTVIQPQSPLSVEAQIKKYTLVGDDIYVRRYTNDTIPDWYRDMIANIILHDGTISDIHNAINYLESLPEGFNQSILSLKEKDKTINAAVESLVTRDSEKAAAILKINETMVDKTAAQAISETVIASYFKDGGASAWFDTKVSTYASTIEAHGQSIEILSASIDSSNATVEEYNDVLTTKTTALAGQIVDVYASIADTEARIIQSYTVYVNDNLSYNVEIWSSNGNFFRRGNIATTLSAKVKKGNDDITSTIPSANFSWRRISANTVSDDSWNMAHQFVGAEISITTSDVWVKAVFECDITIN